MKKTAKIVIALVAGGLCGMAIPAAVIWPGQALIIGIAAGAVASIAAALTGFIVTKP